jgi:hypothetical protein
LKDYVAAFGKDGEVGRVQQLELGLVWLLAATGGEKDTPTLVSII